MACTLPKADWTHAAHCIAAVHLTLSRPDLNLTRDLPNMIRRYNDATGTANTDTGGYHETITQVYVLATAWFLEHRAAGLTAGEACTRLLASSCGRRDLPLDYYSHARLFSLEARRHWIEPDLQPLDFSLQPAVTLT